jgi:pimeloyl-ACP methyl ester carboxylesterase
MKRTSEIGVRQKNRLYFKSNDLDYQFQSLVLGYAAYGGASIGEALWAILRIDERKLETWTAAWTALADHVEALAREAADKGRRVSASRAFLRSYTYRRASLNMLSCRDAKFSSGVRRMKACFREFARRAEEAFEPVEIPFEGKTLRGYFAAPRSGGKRRPVCITVGGGETYAEDLYFWGGAAGLERGYAVLMIDLPGQGATPFDGMLLRPDTEVPFRALVDYLVARDDVDAGRIFATGVSLGGYLVLRAVSFEERIRACALSTPLVDWHQALMDGAPVPLRTASRLLGALPEISGLLAPSQVATWERFFLWQTGASTMGQALEKFESWRVDVSRVTCPVLCIVGDGEDDTFKKQTRLCYETLTAPKRLIRCTETEGADAHCQANNLQYGHALMYDWFDEVQGEPPREMHR